MFSSFNIFFSSLSLSLLTWYWLPMRKSISLLLLYVLVFWFLHTYADNSTWNWKILKKKPCKDCKKIYVFKCLFVVEFFSLFCYFEKIVRIKITNWVVQLLTLVRHNFSESFLEWELFIWKQQDIELKWIFHSTYIYCWVYNRNLILFYPNIFKINIFTCFSMTKASIKIGNASSLDSLSVFSFHRLNWKKPSIPLLKHFRKKIFKKIIITAICMLRSTKRQNLT